MPENSDDLSLQERVREVCWMVKFGWDFDTAWGMGKENREKIMEAISRVLTLRLKDSN